ncbi:hypothetical protein CMQ_2805 [Grosmannia clavigera kw1407]|uniref:Uncharacterized protein n=1 Tax=Grosmannia clavigera (strain kw1407 / UAMH 11150) TaxID=655863 RepID=F0XGU5_GROCL|nr:uncharacterized protein CMQ_2805 [Grosmannia clavigera kw1407]EFX02876.1 hypothetical protein CMQ_2805 [Grosmannia clavigera kw1407]
MNPGASNSDRAQLVRQLLEILGRFDVDYLSDLARVAHKLLGASVQHAHLIVGRDGEITACGSLERDVPRRNLRSLSLVSCEKVYSLASELYMAHVSEREQERQECREDGTPW